MRAWLIHIPAWLLLASLFGGTSPVNREAGSTPVIDTAGALYYNGAAKNKPAAPHIFVRVGEDNTMQGWIGYEPLAGKGPLRKCWRLAFSQTGERAYEAMWGEYSERVIRPDFRVVKLWQESGAWYCRVGNEKERYALVPYQQTDQTARLMKRMYAEANYNTLRYLFNSSYAYKDDNKPGRKNMIDSLYLRLPFSEYRKVIDGLSVNTLAMCLGYRNNQASPHAPADTLVCPECGKVYGMPATAFFKLLQPALFTGKPAEFTPALSIDRKNYYSQPVKSKRITNNTVQYQFCETTLFVEGYWFMLDRNAAPEIQQIFNMQQRLRK